MRPTDGEVGVTPPTVVLVEGEGGGGRRDRVISSNSSTSSLSMREASRWMSAESRRAPRSSSETRESRSNIPWGGSPSRLR